MKVRLTNLFSHSSGEKEGLTVLRAKTDDLLQLIAETKR